MIINPRAILVIALLFMFALAKRMYGQWRMRVRHDKQEKRAQPRVPAELLGGSERTWVVFTTPYCASCEPVRQRLAGSDPLARVVTVDATREPMLADAFGVRRSPTAVLADGEGVVEARLVGAEAVTEYLAGRAGRR